MDSVPVAGGLHMLSLLGIRASLDWRSGLRVPGCAVRLHLVHWWPSPLTQRLMAGAAVTPKPGKPMLLRSSLQHHL